MESEGLMGRRLRPDGSKVGVVRVEFLGVVMLISCSVWQLAVSSNVLYYVLARMLKQLHSLSVENNNLNVSLIFQLIWKLLSLILRSHISAIALKAHHYVGPRSVDRPVVAASVWRKSTQ